MMLKKEYRQPQIEIIELEREEVLTKSPDQYEGWNPNSSGNSSDTDGGYEGWNPYPSGGTNKYW